MNNVFLNEFQKATNSNLTRTENGAITYKTTESAVLDMFALGASMRKRREDEILSMFAEAYEEDPLYALKCLFYIGDILEGQGERRFFRICIKWLANEHTEVMSRNLELIPIYRRWDDLYTFVGTPLEEEAFNFMKAQLALDLRSKTPSLLAKWLKSENTSSQESRELGAKTRKAFGMTPKQYRKTLSHLREKINVLERLMSANKWDEIDFAKIPSRAGFIYRNAFARHDVERMAAENKTVQSYADFAQDKNTKVNAKVLYPYECVAEVRKNRGWYNSGFTGTDTERAIINKYWDNLKDYFDKASFNGLAVVDVSGSMMGSNASAPINVAVSLGLYCAERMQGPYAGHFITFSGSPKLETVKGHDFCEKVLRMLDADWGYNTNIKAVFDIMLNIATKNELKQEEIPENLLIISDMEFDAAARIYRDDRSLFEIIEKKWNKLGYKLPKLVFWNVAARHNNIPMRETKYVSYVSGVSPVIFDMVLSGKTGADLMYEKLNSERYARVC